MHTTIQNAAIAGAIDAIRNAEILLTQQVRAASDTMTAIKLTNEYNNLDSYLSTLLHAQNAADDVTFAAATKTICSTANGLKADEQTIQAIVKDVAIAAQVLKYLEQALAFVAKL
ncbi:MAG TPA: hypothetical protein VI653_10950 [Steroidobacteraceae bacterium]